MTTEILKLCMGKGFLLDKEVLDLLSHVEEDSLEKVASLLSGFTGGERVVTMKLFTKYANHFEQYLGTVPEFQTITEQTGVQTSENTTKNKEQTQEPIQIKKNLLKQHFKLLSAPAFPQKKVEVKDFVNHFRSRFEQIKGFLEKKDFENLTTIRKIGRERGSYTIIGSVLSKRMTKNKNLLIEVDDLTGTCMILVNQAKKEAFKKARDLLDDDIVAFSATGTSEMLFANDIIFPEANLPEKRQGEHDEYVAFISDMHAGSTMFLKKNLTRFIKWLNGEIGDQTQRELSQKVKYLIINGDNTDGVGIYPGQEKYLDETTMRGQYRVLEELFKLVRKDILMVMGPGQHDSVWVGEPQPIIGEDYAPGLYEIENLHLVPNPSLIEINDGFKILMYHGASINRFIDEIPEIRTKHGHNSPTTVVKEMVKRRHLAPMHGAMDYIPCEKDPLVIDIVPDIITTGDQHKLEISTKNNILLIATSCWQSITPFEEKVGNNPDPCKVPLFNLKTREIKILDFSDDKEELKEVPVPQKETPKQETPITNQRTGTRELAEGLIEAQKDEEGEEEQ